MPNPIENTTRTDRRTTIKLSISLLASASFLACSPSTIAPGQLTLTEINPPIKAEDYKSGYKAPINKFDIQILNFGKAQRQYHAYKSRHHNLVPKTILLLLHGSNRNGASLIDKWRDLADQHNILLIAPDSTIKARWSMKSDSADFMEAVLSHAKAAYNVSEATIYGFGHSAGAIMMTLLSIRHSEIFNAIAVHAGYLPLQTAMLSKKVKKRKTPLAHLIGSNDHIFNIEDAKRSAKILTDHGQNVDVIIIKGHNHWYYDIAPFVNSKAWAFLSTHQ